MPEPIKRHEALQDLSRDHHEGLLLCFKIRQGLAKDIEPQRIMNYCRYFYQSHLIEHFREEEEILFPVLESSHPMVKKALEQHRHLRALFTAETATVQKLQEIEQRLKGHIRFEERELFNEVQQLTTAELAALNQRLSRQRSSSELWEDQFWS